MTDFYLFDAYALFEVLKRDGAYAKYADAGIVTTKLNLFELFHGLLRQMGPQAAHAALERFADSIVDFGTDIIPPAAELKLIFRRQDLSMADCIGYTLARKLGIPFLTGDSKFADKPGVEFVK